MKILHIADGFISVITVLNESLIDDIIPKSGKHWFKDSVDFPDFPDCPQEAWDISEDGDININQDKLIKFNRLQMPILSPLEFDLKLAKHNLYDAVQNLIKTDAEMSIAYHRSSLFNRNYYLIERGRIALGLTHEQVDEIWIN